MGEAVTQAEYARLRGHSRNWASRLKREGRLIFTADGKVDVEATDAALAATLDPSKTRPQGKVRHPGPAAGKGATSGNGPNPGGAYASASAAHKAAQTALAEAKLDLMRGKLLDRSMVEQAAFDAGRAARDKLLALPARLAPMLAGISDRRELHALLKKELTGVLHDFADALGRLPGGDGSDGGGANPAGGVEP